MHRRLGSHACTITTGCAGRRDCSRKVLFLSARSSRISLCHLETRFVELIEVIRYFRTFKNDSWMLKLLVSFTCAVDAVSMIGNYACVYLYTITNGFNPAYLQNQYWPIPLYLFATGVIALSVQMFLIIRYWKLTKNIFVTPVLFFVMLVAAGGSFACGITIAMYPALAQRDKVKTPATIWLVTEAVADLVIALTLIWEFRKAQTAFKDTRSILDRLVAQTLQSGAAGATVAVAALIAYLFNNESNVPVAFGWCLGRIYIITMLSNLNIRQTGRTGSKRGTTSTAQGVQGVRTRSEGIEDYGGIQLHRTALVHIDNVRPEYSGPFRPHPDQVHAQEVSDAEIEMKVTDSASYSSNKHQDLFPDMA
ncbi:hypothetical protein C8R45DRAFT_327377 [Mycena sanguinolenta]|nr:hypothetical protein C8R45DRAFT_327377 [Mycena sanguinolenta]